MEQLSLWGEEEMVPLGYRIVPDEGGTMEMTHTWADGDSSPASLDRLAKVLLFDGDSFRTTDGLLIWTKIIATRVEGDHVVAVHQRIAPVLRQKSVGNDDEDEELI